MDPATREVQTCQAAGWGVDGVKRAVIERGVCLATLRSLGFRPLPTPSPDPPQSP